MISKSENLLLLLATKSRMWEYKITFITFLARSAQIRKPGLSQQPMWPYQRVWTPSSGKLEKPETEREKFPNQQVLKEINFQVSLTFSFNGMLTPEEFCQNSCQFQGRNRRGDNTPGQTMICLDRNGQTRICPRIPMNWNWVLVVRTCQKLSTLQKNVWKVQDFVGVILDL